MNLSRILTFIVQTILLSQAAIAGESDYGRRLAENWCSPCHAVSAGERSENKTAPSFSAVAQSPDFSSDRLAYLLLDPHPKMAKLALSRKAIDDISAYIQSLKK